MLLRFAGAIGAFATLGWAVAAAQPASCVSDAELETAFGPAIRSGAATISPGSLGDRPTCSGHGFAQAIQHLRQRLLAPASPPPNATAPLAPARAAFSPAANAPASAAADLLKFIDKHNYMKVGGHTFLTHPAVVGGLQRAGVSTAAQRDLHKRHQVVSAITLSGGRVVDRGCVEHNCSDEHYAIYADPRSGDVALCLFDQGTAQWFTAAGKRTVSTSASCPTSFAEAPQGLGEADDDLPELVRPGLPAGTGSALPDISRALVFDEPSYCGSDTMMRIFGDAADRGGAVIGPLGRVAFARSRSGGPTLLAARIAARWNGLTVERIAYEFEPNSDILSRLITFREPPAQVIAVLRRLGLPAARGQRTVSQGEGMDLYISVEPEGRGAQLSCSYG